MTALNRIWAAFFGEGITRPDDWVRPHDPAQSHQALTAGIFADRDPNIRGWLVEAAVQMALRSSFRSRLLEADGCNSYGQPLQGLHTEFLVDRPDMQVFPEAVNRDLGIYRQRASLELLVDDGAVMLSGTGADGSSLTGGLTAAGRLLSGVPYVEGGTVSLALPDGEETVSVGIHAVVLPAGPPSSIFRERFLGRVGGGEYSQWPVAEMAGWLALQAVGGDR